MIAGNEVPANEEHTLAIDAHSIFVHYTKCIAPALQNLTLEVRQGEFYGLLGTNGAGKTTAVSILSGFFQPDSGTVRIMGMEYGRQTQQIRQVLGLVPQDIAVYEKLTARENLQFFGRMYGFAGNELQRRVEDSLAFAQLSGQASRLVATFSGGMKRRLNLAAGLLHSPKILFLDEPTVGIDTQSRHLILNQLAALNREGTTILYTTHYMEEAQELCSRVGIIDNGAIVEQGAPAALLENSGSRNLEELFLQLTGKQLRDV